MVITIEKKQFFLIVNRSKYLSRYLCNETILSRFSFSLKPKIDVASVVVGSANDVSASILLVSRVL